MRHTRATNVCHVCAKEIRDKQAFEKHVRLHFEDSGPRIKCPHSDCDSWLKDKDNLKQHLRRHNDAGKSFICKHCNRACKNRRSLTSHINYVHGNETFSCEECNKTFKKAITLRVCYDNIYKNTMLLFIRISCFIKGAHGSAYWRKVV